ncbi:tetratricopeptide repeat protein GNN [Elysia marginata]|uniref:Tetratricopeptide repeat protein GNN n=1 Tax=Elysia marginata TaxID=1093978 RepID=A0AAV4EMT2_9GAST|nr:tetratricopeptide repeat protein GNN [Elysia marginata]
MASISYDPAMILRLASMGPRQVYHAHLAQFFAREPLDTQVMEELPWQLMWSGHVAELTDFLTDCGALLKMLSSEGSLWQQDLKLYWSVCQLRGHCPATVYLQLTQSLGIVNTDDIPTHEERNSYMGSPTEFLQPEQTPRIVVSTPQPPHTNGHGVEDWGHSNWTHQEDKHNHSGAEEIPHSGEDGLFFEDIETKHGNYFSSPQTEKRGLVSQGKSESDQKDSQPLEAAAAMFLTQEDTEDDAILTSGSVDRNTHSRQEEENNFPGVFSLCWQLARFLQALSENEASGLVLSSLIKYIKKNYPLTLEQQLLLCRCHHSAGSLAETAGDWNHAELEYRQALHALVAAEDMDDELKFLEDTKYLKGLLLSCHGNLRIVGDVQFEAEELLKEALECVEDNPNCLVLKSAIFANLGQLRHVQGDFRRAETCLREATRLRCRWFGRCHALVADVLVSLAQLLAAPGNTNGQDVIQAEHLFRQALTISEKCFGANSLSVASVLFHLGELLAHEESHPAKMEAQKLLRRSMDIRTSELGGNHPVSQCTQQSLTRVDVALKMGHYEFGSARHTERRANNLPFSNLTFREDDLNRLQSRMSMIRADTGEGREQPISIRAVSREEVMRHNRPDSILSYGGGPGAISMSSMASASERLLTAPIGDRPERLLARRKKDDKAKLRGNYGQSNTSLPECRGDSGGDLVFVESLDSKGRRHIVGHKTRNHTTSSNNCNVDGQQDQRKFNESTQDEDPEHNGGVEHLDLDLAQVNLEPVQQGSVSQGRQTVTVDIRDGQGLSNYGETQDIDNPGGLAQNTNAFTDDEMASQRVQQTVSKKSVVIRPTSGSRRMFEKYSSGGNSPGEIGDHNGSMMNMSRPSITSAKPSTRATSAAKTMSARSRRVWSGRSITSSATSSHASRRHIPGPHDLATSSRSVGGPNSSLSSLLGDPPRPRPASRPSEHHHRAAWYHVPGRYSTPQERFPRKRMQKTENARDIEAFVALKSQWAKRRQMELQQARLKSLQLEEEGGNHNEAQTESELTPAAHAKHTTKKNPVSSSKSKATAGWSSKFATRSADSRPNIGPTRRLIHPDSTPRLMISGLDMVPEQRYPDRSPVYYSSSQTPAVKFREPIIVG